MQGPRVPQARDTRASSMLMPRSPSRQQCSCQPCPGFCRSLYLGIQAFHQLTGFIWVWCLVSTEIQEQDRKRRENKEPDEFSLLCFPGVGYFSHGTWAESKQIWGRKLPISLTAHRIPFSLSPSWLSAAVAVSHRVCEVLELWPDQSETHCKCSTHSRFKNFVQKIKKNY